jgi:hypothetical protein
MDYLTEIKIHRGMVGTQELDDAVDHNSRCEIVAIIDIALREALENEDFVTNIKLSRLKGEAMKEDFGDYGGEHYYAEEDYENKVVAIMEGQCQS